MSTKESERQTAIAAADRTCPRCGTERAANQRYCLECGLPLPDTTGRLSSLRRRWIRRFGWYPGDWVWVSLLTLVVAAAGATAAIVISERRANAHASVVVATGAVSVTQPTPVPTTTHGARVSTTPTTGRAAAQNGRFQWPTGENGWTIVLVSYPKTYGRPTARQTAGRAAHAGLPQVGILDSSLYPSLQPGYYVVFTGVYGTKSDADAGVSTARHAGFAGAYSRQIAR